MRGRKFLAISLFCLSAVSVFAQQPSQEFRFVVLGTLVGNNSGQNSFAVLYDIEKNKQSIFSQGSVIDSWRIKSIRRGKVVFERNGIEKSVELPPEPEKKAFIPINKKEQVLNRIAFSKNYPDLNAVLKAVSISPYIEDGKLIGLKIDSMDKNLSKMSRIKEGDIVLEVNNQKVNSLSQFLTLYETIKSAPKVNVKIKRGRKVISYIYHMNWDM